MAVMLSIDLNADLGEIPEEEARDFALLDIVSSCSIACGGHAGDARSMTAMIAAAKARGVAIGAHPSYPDRAHFGRRSIAISGKALAANLAEQITAFVLAAAEADYPVSHVKPHGALYNDMAGDPALADIVVQAIARHAPGAAMLGLAGSVLSDRATTGGIDFIGEAFVDRRYTSEGRLVPRTRPGAIIENPAARAAQAVSLARDARVDAEDGKQLAIAAESLCLHSDSADALAGARAIRGAIESAGIAIAPARRT